jgi:hypothetical protein
MFIIFKIIFGVALLLQVPAEGNISINAVKDKLAVAVGVPAEMLYLEFMSQPIGRFIYYIQLHSFPHN